MHMSTALRWSLIVTLGLVPISVHFTMIRYAGNSYYLEFFSRWLVSGIVFGVITYVIVQSVSAMKRAIRKSPLNQSFSGKKERENIESNPERHSNDENKNPVSRIDRTHDKSYEIAWDEIESGNKDKAVWARAFSLADGAEDKAKAIYISLRVSMLGEGQKSTEHKPANPTKGVSVNWRDLEPGDKVIAIIVFAAISFSIIFLLLSS